MNFHPSGLSVMAGREHSPVPPVLLPQPTLLGWEGLVSVLGVASLPPRSPLVRSGLVPGPAVRRKGGSRCRIGPWRVQSMPPASSRPCSPCRQPHTGYVASPPLKPASERQHFAVGAWIWGGKPPGSAVLDGWCGVVLVHPAPKGNAIPLDIPAQGLAAWRGLSRHPESRAGRAVEAGDAVAAAPPGKMGGGLSQPLSVRRRPGHSCRSRSSPGSGAARKKFGSLWVEIMPCAPCLCLSP